jgi:thymidine kinase
MKILNDGMGYLEIILGPMFSGKTSRIIDIYKQYKYCNIKVIVINYEDDNRYDNVLLSNHDNIKIECLKCHKIMDIIKNIDFQDNINSPSVILINEGQFFDDLIESVDLLVNNYNKCVYVCGLDGDYKMNKFGTILDLIPLCDKVTKLNSICSNCKNGRSASFTYRKNNDTIQKVIGTNDIYEPVCRSCYFKLNNKIHNLKINLNLINNEVNDSLKAPRMEHNIFPFSH